MNNKWNGYWENEWKEGKQLQSKYLEVQEMVSTFGGKWNGYFTEKMSGGKGNN